MIATFADDTVLMSSSACEKTAASALQQIMTQTVSWFERWGIEIKKDKTQQVIYTKRQPKNFAIKINDNQILLHPYAKYLGLTIDSKLTWEQHILNKRNEIK